MRAVLFIPFAGLVVLAGILGFRVGQASAPSETAIILRWANAYVDEIGETAQVSHCAAKPHALDEIWMLITCAHPDTGGDVRRYGIAPNGALLTASQIATLEPDT